ncbi:MAG TPA: acyl carrier protein [Clostridiales bacterium]|nr:acyl carrier protein [Clostridiales bacterium]
MTFDKVKKLLADQLNIDAGKITENSKVIDDLGADSLDVVEMLMTLEDEFNVTVTDEESVNLKTVGDIVKLIDSKTKK